MYECMEEYDVMLVMYTMDTAPILKYVISMHEQSTYGVGKVYEV